LTEVNTDGKRELENHVSAAICWCKMGLGFSIRLPHHSTL